MLEIISDILLYAIIIYATQGIIYFLITYTTNRPWIAFLSVTLSALILIVMNSTILKIFDIAVFYFALFPSQYFIIKLHFKYLDYRDYKNNVKKTII